MIPALRQTLAPNRTNTKGGLGALLLATTLSCSPSSKQDGPYLPESRDTVCRVADNALGSWTRIEQPPEVLGLADLAARHQFSDGETFSVQRKNVVGRMLSGTVDWEILETDRSPTITGEISAATQDFLLVAGGMEEDGSGDASKGVELLDLGTGVWQRLEPPPEVWTDTRPKALVSTGTEFILWGSYDSTGVEGEYAFYSDAALLDPSTGEWRRIPGPIEPTPYRVDDLAVPIFEHFSAGWSSRGLVFWGILPDGTEPVGHVWDQATEQWSALPSKGAPSRRRSHRLVVSDDGFFVVGGIHPDYWEENIYLGGLWHFSWSSDQWTEIDVPDYAGLSRGAWLDGKLYVFGGCDSDAVYDYEAGTWDQLPALSLPETGTPFVAGDRIILTDIQDHIEEVRNVYVYDPATASNTGP